MTAMMPEARVSAAAAAPAPLSARRLLGMPVMAPDGCGRTMRIADVCEVYFTPDHTRLLGVVVFRPANVLGGGEMFWLPEADIALLTGREVLVAGMNGFHELDLTWRVSQAAHRLEMLRARPHTGHITRDLDLNIEPITRRVLACTCAGKPATLLAGA